MINASDAMLQTGTTMPRMLILAIEQSTQQGGAVLLDGAGRLVAERLWIEADTRQHRLHSFLPGLLAEAGPDTAAAITHYIIGSGPGSYSGLRVASAAAQAMALPGAAAAGGIPSTAALAAALLRDDPALMDVAVIGDARRGHWWVHAFSRDGGGQPTPRHAPLLRTPATLTEMLPAGTLVVTSDWERLATPLGAAVAARADLRLERAALYPLARDLAAVARARLLHGQPLDPPLPLYLHAAVG